MADYELKAEPVLGNYCRQFGDNTLKEIAGFTMVAVACPLDGVDDLATAVKEAWKIALPETGSSSISDGKTVRLLGMARDQFFAVFQESIVFPEKHLVPLLGNAGYYTDQTDNWCLLELSGPNALDALERICPINLEIGAFPTGSVGRTVMEHSAAIVYRHSDSGFSLFGASSSAGSFLHAIETSLFNVT